MTLNPSFSFKFCILKILQDSCGESHELLLIYEDNCLLGDDACMNDYL